MSMSRSVLRHMVLAMVMSVVALGATAAENDHNQTVRNISEEKWVSAGAEHFTGNVQMRNAFAQVLPARSYGAYVRFEPGARTFWHIHPTGQTLIVTEGVGLTQSVDSNGNMGPVIEIKAGDIVVCPPGIRHWHGASENSSMTHLAMSERDPNKAVQWLDPVTEAEYKGAKK